MGIIDVIEYKGTQETKVRQDIIICQQYIDLDRDKIEEMLFAMRCEAFGVKQEYDSKIKEFREAALNTKQ